MQPVQEGAPTPTEVVQEVVEADEAAAPEDIQTDQSSAAQEVAQAPEEVIREVKEADETAAQKDREQ